MNIAERVSKVVARHFGTAKVSGLAHISDFPEADSLDLLELVMEIEDEFDEMIFDLSHDTRITMEITVDGISAIVKEKLDERNKYRSIEN